MDVWQEVFYILLGFECYNCEECKIMVTLTLLASNDYIKMAVCHVWCLI